MQQENGRRERQYFQERFAPMHQPSGLSVDAAPFQPQAAVPMPRPAEMPRDPPEAERRGSKDGHSPSHRMTTSSVGKIPSPWGVPTHRPLMTTSPQMGVWWTPPPAGKGKEVVGAEEAEAERAQTALTPSDPLPLGEAEGRRKMGFLAKSRSQSLVGKRVIQVRSLMPSDSGLGASPTTGTTMRTLT